MNGSRRHDLAITTAVADGSPITLISIDGVNLLELQQPLRIQSRRLWSPVRERVAFGPPDPVDLLPPDSMSLLPTALPRPAMVGICGCGYCDCDSLWLQVHRRGGDVLWEPDLTSPRSTIDASYVFDLRQYLDAVDAGQASTMKWETRARLLARELRRRRSSLFGFDMISWRGTEPVAFRLLDAAAWLGYDKIILTVATATGVRQAEIVVTDDVTDDEILQMISTVDDERVIWRPTGRPPLP